MLLGFRRARGCPGRSDVVLRPFLRIEGRTPYLRLRVTPSVSEIAKNQKATKNEVCRHAKGRFGLPLSDQVLRETCRDQRQILVDYPLNYGSLVTRRLRSHFQPAANRHHLMHWPLCGNSLKSISGATWLVSPPGRSWSRR